MILLVTGFNCNVYIISYLIVMLDKLNVSEKCGTTGQWTYKS